MTVNTPPAPALPPISDAYRSALRGQLSQVSVITVGAGTAATGLVVSTASSLTLDPPQMLACIAQGSSALPHLTRGAAFGWSALGAAHRSVAERFSGRTGAVGPARYEGAEWEQVAGAALLVGAPFACAAKVVEMLDRGSHYILIGEVLDMRLSPEAGSLGYRAGSYLSVP